MYSSFSLSSQTQLTKDPVVWSRTFLYTFMALAAFAANSILCRMALETAAVDPARFTTIRLLSGAISLGIIGCFFKASHNRIDSSGNWISALMLFFYATAFSFAYLRLSTAMGALILFGGVQVTMLSWGLFKGERPNFLQYGGIATAAAGFVYLLLPRIERPSLTGAVLMAAAGISWGIYCLRGQGLHDPLAVTGGNFIRTLPMLIPLNIFLFRDLDISLQGMVLGILSGALASGMGYVVWYKALKTLSTTRAATVQLLVPVLAALGGVAFLHEVVSTHLIVAALLILSGIFCHILGKRK